MYSYFSDLQVELLSRGVLEPGEQLTGKTVTRYMPWWAFGLVNRTYLILTTDRRVILLNHKLKMFHQAQSLEAVESIPWANVQELVLKGIFAKKVRLRGQAQSGPINLTMKVPNQLFGLLAPMRGNMDGARAVTGAFTAQRGMLGGQAPAQMGGAFGGQQMLPPASQQPSSYYPPQNAPGYASVPPSAPQQQPQQFGQPPFSGRSYPQA
jgi:hypothetical protein